MLISCKSSLQNYSGYIYFDKTPLKEAKIIDINNNSYTYTDSRGHFNLKRLNDYNMETIVILQQNKQTDTVQLLRKNGADAKPYYMFQRENILDTLFLERERYFKKQIE